MGREIKVALVDDNWDFCSASVSYFNYLFEKKSDYPYDIKVLFGFYHVGDFDDPDKIFNNLVKEKYDMYLVDYYLRSTIKREDGFFANCLAEKLKERNPFTPVIMVSGLDLRERERDTIAGLQEGLFNGVWTKSSDIEDLFMQIRGRAWKPISVGVEGSGDYAKALVEYLNGSSHVSSIYWHGEGMKERKEEIFNFLEEIDLYGEGKVHLVERGELLEKADFLTLCASSLSKEEVRDMAGKGLVGRDRFGLFPYEVEKFGRIFDEIKNSSFEGLVNIQSNHIGGLAALAKASGISPQSITSFFHTDVARVVRTLKSYEETVKDDFKKRDNFSFGKFFSEVENYVVGIHGTPKVVIPERWEDGLSLEDRVAIKKAEQKAEEAGYLSQAAVNRLGRPYVQAQYELSKHTKDLACFTKLINGYCHHNFSYKKEVYEGFVSVPMEVSYDPIGVVRNKSFIKDEERGIGHRRLYFDEKGPQLALLLKEQTGKINEVLREKGFKV